MLNPPLIFILLVALIMVASWIIYLVDKQKRANETPFKASDNNKKIDQSVSDSGGGEVNDYFEANIVQVNKTDGVSSTPVDPNKLTIRNDQQYYKLDIVIDSVPLDEAIKNDQVKKKR